MCKSNKGGFKDTPLDALVFKILQQVIRKSNIDPQLVEDICLGNVRVISHCSFHIVFIAMILIVYR